MPRIRRSLAALRHHSRMSAFHQFPTLPAARSANHESQRSLLLMIRQMMKAKDENHLKELVARSTAGRSQVKGEVLENRQLH